MPVIISGSTGISGNDGSASVPTIQGTDTNTGMFFPAADQIAFAEGGVEAMRLDASGRVGIGTSSPGHLLTVNGQAAFNQIILPGSVNYVTAPAAGSVIAFQTSGIDRASILGNGDFQFNSGYGSVATAFGCRAWVNFNGTGTVAIRGSGNVSSITDNNVGDYRVNFTSAMPDANYSVAVSGAANAATRTFSPNSASSLATGSVTVQTTQPAVGFVDVDLVTVAIFR